MVKAGATVTDIVRIINLSSTPVEVDAQPGCGCTVASVPDKPLAPLDSELVKLEVDTDGIGKGQHMIMSLKQLPFIGIGRYVLWLTPAAANATGTLQTGT